MIITFNKALIKINNLAQFSSKELNSDSISMPCEHVTDFVNIEINIPYQLYSVFPRVPLFII